MQIPVRLLLLMRSTVSVGILLAVGFSTFVLAATPFLLGPVSDHYGIGLGAASLIGVLQLGGFVVGSWGSGRRLTPRRRVFIIALVLAVAANVASVPLPPFPVLVGLRLLSGLSLGVISWFAWVQVFGDDSRMGEIAVIGPATGVVASPLIALAAERGEANGIFLLLSALAVVPLFFNRGSGAADAVPAVRDRTRPVRAAVVLLACLGLFTLGGSVVFQFAVVLGTENVGLSASTIALIFSANSIAAIPASRWPWRRGLPGPWLVSTSVCAVVVSTASSPVPWAIAVGFWGFAFWMGIPGVFKVLAERSANPADRAGDAQAVMAAGRVAGPLVGGLTLDALGSTALGVIGGSMMAAAGIVVFATRTTVRPRPVDDSMDSADDHPAPGAGSEEP